MTAIFAQGQTIAANRDVLRKHFNAVDWFPVAKPSACAYTDAPAHPGSVCVLAFKTDDAGQIVPVPVEYQEKQSGPIRLPAGTHLLLVPTSVDRPPGDRAGNQIVAVVLTPGYGGRRRVCCGASALRSPPWLCRLPFRFIGFPRRFIQRRGRRR